MKKTIIFLFLGMLLSIILVNYTGIRDVKFFETTELITFIGVLLGFSLTLYTFGLTIIKDVYKSINLLKFRDKKKKVVIKNYLKDMFSEIEDNIKVMFFSIVFVFVSALLGTTQNPFGMDVEYLEIPKTLNVFLFIISSYAMYDIIYSLFLISKLIFGNSKNKL
ncbi:hypothetical protein EDC17_101156 [Sphingobacterium alimentarium]|uniref:Uncharacterized protein n=1 Tax=Sphingobacterium alimentarium TaxID=797292 RepID=A0A4R3VXX6_9SPHI|nr:hypothetical protein [Sphingobacterium alimentarium]TCV17139.1 hypothetical protein EDC17_101156 [Sphingobacterium alimentarium]